MVISLALSAVLAANPYLDEGRRHFTSLDFEEAIRSMRIAVQQPGLTDEERCEAYDVWAQAALALGRPKEAESAYVTLLEKDPYAPAAAAAAPKVRETFLRAKRRLWPPPGVTLQREAADSESLTVVLFDPWQLVQRVRWLEVTERAVEAEQTATASGPHRYAATPSKAARRVLFDALGTSGQLLAHLEVPLGNGVTAAAAGAAPPAAGVSSSPVAQTRAFPIASVVLGGASAVAAGLSAVFFVQGYRTAPPLTQARDINAWNQEVSTQATLAWTLATVALAAAVAALVLGLR